MTTMGLRPRCGANCCCTLFMMSFAFGFTFTPVLLLVIKERVSIQHVSPYLQHPYTHIVHRDPHLPGSFMTMCTSCAGHFYCWQ